MKTFLAISSTLFLAACVSPLEDKTRRVRVVEADSGTPVAGIELEILAIKRPYWIVGHLQKIGIAESDEQGVFIIPERATVRIPSDSRWIEDFPPPTSAPGPDKEIKIRIKKEPNNAVEPTPVSVTISAAQEVAPLTSAAHLGR